MNRRTFAGLAAGPLAARALGPRRALAAPGPAPRPLILAHYMPWFEARPFSEAWGWHWTMGKVDPDRVGPDGRRPVAAHLDPAIGPYDSGDPRVLEYHALLMKVAGIDGVIIDWYGTDDLRDYGAIHHRTLALVAVLRRHGLKFALCYEDRALKAGVETRGWTPDEAVAHARAHLKFAAEAWFPGPSYVSLDGRPLLMVFGPDHLKADQWAAALAGIKPAPALFSLDEKKAPAVGSFSWPPMWASKGGVLARADLDAYLDRFGREGAAKVPAAFGGFHDYYAEAGARASYGFLEDAGGATLRHTLDRALALKPRIVQVATWNDFGEGTAVEPTFQRGTRDLAIIQDARRRLGGGKFAFEPGDFDLPGAIYHLRQATTEFDPRDKQELLDGAARAIVAGNPKAAREELRRARRPRGGGLSGRRSS